MNLDSIDLHEVMIHDVPRGDSEKEPTLTDTPVQLDADLRAYFRRKLKASLETRGVHVVADPDADPAVRDAVTTILRRKSALAAQSKAVAVRLAEAQTGVNPEGLLVVIDVGLDGGRAVAILKLEREQGIRFEIKTVNGAATVDLEFLRQLTLTKKTRVFKTALFTTPDVTDPMKVEGRASDN